MARHTNLYQRAVYYDIGLRRDVQQQVNFVCDLYARIVGRPPQRILDLACGPGYHALEVARQGKQAVALDLMPEMIQLGQTMADAEGLTLEWVVGDMCDFQLHTPVDAAICMFDGIDVLTSNGDVLRHFQCVAENLTENGLYILQMTHPRESSLMHYGQYGYSGERDGIQVSIEWATNQPQFDLVTGIACVESRMTVNDHGMELVINDIAYERLFSPQEVTLLAELSGRLRTASWYGDFNLEQPLDHTEKSRWTISALQKQT